MKIKPVLFAIFTYVAGCITGLSGFIDGISKLPESYNQMKKNYLDDSTFLDGHWSTNSDYVANSGDLGLENQQPLMVMSIQTEKDGSVTGEIMSEGICDALPLTWYINFDSDEPSWIDFFRDRRFKITQLHNGVTETVAVLKLEHKNEKFGAITFEVIKDMTGILPSKIIFGKNLPEYKNDYKKLQDYCGDSPRRFAEKYRAILKKNGNIK